MFKYNCARCNGTGICSGCGGRGCNQCGTKDGWTNTYRGNKVGSCSACNGTGKS